MRLLRGIALVAAGLLLAAGAGGPALAAESASPPPVLAAPDSYAVDEDATLFVPAPGVLENDTTLPTSCAAALDTSALSGDLTLDPDGSFTFTPTSNFNGETSFTYGLQAVETTGCAGPYDGQATVTITVDPVNDAPTAQPDSFQFIWGQTLNIAAPGILANDSDIDGDDLTALKATSPAHGTLTLAADGGFSYTPAAGAACPGLADAFSYRAWDGKATSPVRIVLLNPAALPCPTPFVPPTPSPTPAATPTPTLPPPSAQPSADASPSAGASPSTPPSPEGTTPGSASPSPSAGPGPVADGGGVSLPVLLVLVLLVALLAFGAAFAVPRLLGRAGPDEPGDDVDGGPYGRR